MTDTTVLVADRQEGKTTAAIRWLIDGHAVDGWPGWSRLLVVPSRQRAQWVVGSFPALQHELWEKGNGGLGKLVVTVEELGNLRGMHRDVEIALDDADEVIGRLLGRAPAFITYNGRVA